MLKEEHLARTIKINEQLQEQIKIQDYQEQSKIKSDQILKQYVSAQRCLQRAKPIVSTMMNYIIRKEQATQEVEVECLLEELRQSVANTMG